MNRARYSLTYQFFAAQIRFGYYKTGDFLPTIEEMRQIYHTSARTVRSAYLQLQEDGYISLSPGRRTVVIYQSGPEEYGRARRDYYLARKDAALALNEALRVLLLPLMREGCGCLSGHDLIRLKESSAKLEAGDFYISFIGCRLMILAAKNRLALDLYNEVLSFFLFPHTLLRLGDPNLPVRRVQELSRQATEACTRNDREAFFHAYLQIQGFMDAVLRDYLARAAQEHPAQEQAAFKWGVYRARPQLCYTLAARIIEQIYISCIYAPGTDLPHHAALADEHRVSYMTVRRTVNMMEALGVVSIHHGAGTTVIRPQTDPNGTWDTSARRIHAMAREAMQILRNAFDGLVLLSPQARESARDCIEKLRAQRARGLRFPAFITCMDFLLRGSSQPMQAIWRKFYEALLLDLPLLEASGRQIADPDALIHGLETGDIPAFRQALREQLLQLSDVMDAVERSADKRPGAEPL